MILKIFTKKEKEEFEKQLEKQFGISKVSGIISMRGKERIFLFTGNMKINEIKNIENLTFIERAGIYFAKIDEKTKEIRLSIEGSQILGKQATKNVFSLPDGLVEKWVQGSEILLEDVENEISSNKNLNSKKAGAARGDVWGKMFRKKEKIQKGFYIIKNREDFLGTGKISDEKIGNFIPKNRRLKVKG